jgi:hypothetical protein
VWATAALEKEEEEEEEEEEEVRPILPKHDAQEIIYILCSGHNDTL